MTETVATPARAATDKREALLAAALARIARSGLHNTPTSAVAREARVAAGTLYLYFPSKEALINALYLKLVGDQQRAASERVRSVDGAGTNPRTTLWRSWHGLARWHLDHPEASRVMQQCQTSGILTAETRDIEQRAREAGLAEFRDAIARGMLRELPAPAFWALYAGPIFMLAEGDGEVTDDVLRATFDGVCRSVLPPSDTIGG